MDCVSRLAKNTTGTGAPKGATVINVDLAFPRDTNVKMVLGGNWHSAMSCVNIINCHFRTRGSIDDCEVAVKKGTPVEDKPGCQRSS
jgi:hypothetical protein